MTDKQYRSVSQWLSRHGEFKIVNPHQVAKLWGMRKSKPKMNYDNLARALRYYNGGDLIAKVKEKRFVYKFLIDLKRLIGYDAEELSNLINDT